MTKLTPCCFCNVDESEAVLSNDHAIAIADGFPITPGHCLIVPRRHISSFFEATPEEQRALFDLLAEVRQLLLRPQPLSTPGGPVAVSPPDGFNIGVNDGPAAGQTVMHLHIHLIPRYLGDTEDPRGGVRWIMPVKAPYWKKMNGTGSQAGERAALLAVAL
ncbi:HIT family protein [Geobacter sp. FeAm09]|uniref:HIT family protein n=1 Tax=Geobacter sp. FeAm09 TaxID=2597769 RepID=UPI00197A8071|nr:HIT family protein [Geobacter sp. FeAm09]